MVRLWDPFLLEVVQARLVEVRNILEALEDQTGWSLRMLYMVLDGIKIQVRKR